MLGVVGVRVLVTSQGCCMRACRKACWLFQPQDERGQAVPFMCGVLCAGLLQAASGLGLLWDSHSRMEAASGSSCSNLHHLTFDITRRKTSTANFSSGYSYCTHYISCIMSFTMIGLYYVNLQIGMSKHLLQNTELSCLQQFYSMMSKI